MVSSVFILFAIVPLALWVWALVDLLKTPIQNSTDKLIWLAIVLVANFLGSILWLAWGKKNTKIL